MKIFAKTKLWQKMIIALALIGTLFVVAPKPVHAVPAGGDLMRPICSFIAGLGDGLIDVIHQVMIRSGRTIIRIDVEQGILETLIVIIGSVVVCCLVISLIVSTAGTVTAPLLALVGQVGPIAAVVKGIAFVVALGSGIYASAWVYDSGLWGDDEVVLPLYSITPEEIFRNDDEFPLLSVNFFNKDDNKYIEYEYSVKDTTKLEEDGETLQDETTRLVKSVDFSTIAPIVTGVNQETPHSMKSKLVEDGAMDEDDDFWDEFAEGNDSQGWNNILIKYEENGFSSSVVNYFMLKGKTLYRVKVDNGICSLYKATVTNKKNTSGATTSNSNTGGNNTHVLSPGGPAAGSQGANAASAKKRENTSIKKGRIYPISYQISDYVMSGYVALRTIAAVGMMSVLVYIGIRILISSTSPQKAKYKQMLGDWLVGMVLLFTMHFIMYFSNVFVDELSKFLASINPCLYTQIIEDENGKVTEAIEDAGFELVDKKEGNGATISKDTINGKGSKKIYTYTQTGSDGKEHTYVEWHTNLMGALRVRLNYNAKGDAVDYIGYTIMFIVMVMYTVIFLWIYIKRLIYLAFLTLIAPLVALTYPIDKVNDGSAQGFNYWFKEYIFNLLLQPVHLLIYTVMVGSAINLAAQNVIYGLVALGFVATAEKIVRKMFNFQKAETPGAFAGAGGAALTMTGMRWLLGHGPKNEEKKDDSNDGKYSSTQGSRTVQDRLKEFNVEDDSKDVSNSQEKEEKPVKQKETPRLGDGEDDKPVEGEKPIRTKDDEEQYDGDEYDSIQLEDLQNKTKVKNDNTDGESESDSEIPPTDNTQDTQKDTDTDDDIIQEKLPDSIEDYNDEQTEKYINSMGYAPGYLDARRQLKQLDSERTKWGDDSALNSRRQLLNDFRHEEAKRIAKANRKQKIKGYANKAGARVSKEVSGFGRGMAGVGRNYLEKQNERFKRAQKTGLKRIGGIAAGATFGLAGMAAGIASGNPSQVLQNTTIGAAAGYKFGANVAGAGGNTLADSKEAFERGRLGEEEYARRQAKKYQLEVARDEKTISLIQQKMKVSRREAKEIALEMVPKYMDAKVNSIEEMIKLEKFRKNKQYVDKDGNMRRLKHGEVAQLEKLRKMYNMRLEDKDNKKESITKNMMRNMKINGVNISKSTAESWQNMTRDYMNFTEN